MRLQKFVCLQHAVQEYRRHAWVVAVSQAITRQIAESARHCIVFAALGIGDAGQTFFL